jgi:hypothetical protein
MPAVLLVGARSGRQQLVTADRIGRHPHGERLALGTLSRGEEMTRPSDAPHTWVPDDSVPPAPDPWPARTGTVALKCEGCMARGHRQYEVTESKYDGFHAVHMPIYGHVTRESGPTACPGYDLIVERRANWMVGLVGYLLWAGAAFIVAIATSYWPQYAQLLWQSMGRYYGQMQQDFLLWVPIVGAIVGSFLGWAFVANARAESVRIEGELDVMRHRRMFGVESTPASDPVKRGDLVFAAGMQLGAGLTVVGTPGVPFDSRTRRQVPPIGSHPAEHGIVARLDTMRRMVTYCQADPDGECVHKLCPQLRDKEPRKSGRHCPLDSDDLGSKDIARILMTD